MGHLHSLSSSCSKDLGLSGSKFLSKIKDLNLAFLLTNFSSLLLLLSDASFFTILDVFDAALAASLSLWALPITAFLVVPPRISAI